MQHQRSGPKPTLFDPVVFDDSVKEFLNLKVKLADYFDESRTCLLYTSLTPKIKAHYRVTKSALAEKRVPIFCV